MFKWMPVAAVVSLVLVGCDGNKGSVKTALVCTGQEQRTVEQEVTTVDVTALPAVLERSLKEKPKSFSVETKLIGPLTGKYCGDSSNGDYIFRPGDCTNIKEFLAYHPEKGTVVVHLAVHRDNAHEYRAKYLCVAAPAK